jgi:chromosome partitioning protein
MPRVIGFISQKGGVGKSTLARALAREAAASGLSVRVCSQTGRAGSVLTGMLL